MASSNVSSVVNYFPTSNEGFTTTLGSTILSGAATVPLASTTGLTNGTIFVGIIEPGATNQQVFTGTVDTGGGQITGVKWTRGTNVGHTVGASIVDYVTGTAFNMLSAGFLKQHTQTGTHGAVTATSVATSGNTTVGGTLGVTGTATHSGATVLTGAVSGAGYDAKTQANSYKFSVYLNSPQTVTSAGLVLCDTKVFDTGNNVDIVTHKGRFTAPVNGFYMFNANVAYQINGNANVAYGAVFLKNGTGGYAGAIDVNAYGGNYTLQKPVTKFLQLTAGDYIELYVAACSGSGTALTPGVLATFFEGFLVSAT